MSNDTIDSTETSSVPDAPKGSKNRRNAFIAVGVAVVIIVVGLTIGLVANANSKNQAAQKRANAVALRKQVANMFLSEEGTIKTLVAASHSCTTPACFSAAVTAAGASLNGDLSKLTNLALPGVAEHNLALYFKVINSVKGDLVKIAAVPTLAAQLKKFNQDLVGAGMSPAATAAFYNSAIQLIYSIPLK